MPQGIPLEINQVIVTITTGSGLSLFDPGDQQLGIGGDAVGGALGCVKRH